MKKMLISAGSTSVMIDSVRCISNVFKGRTGFEIANEAIRRGYDVTLLTSGVSPTSHCKVIKFFTYDELATKSQQLIENEDFDVIVWSAAISDYKVEGAYVSDKRWTSHELNLERLDSSTKISSSESELYLKLVPTEKLIDKIREPWGFKGKLVKFKLQVGISDVELIDIATESMKYSKADFIVANCLEWSRERAFIINPRSGYEVLRNDLPRRLIEMLEQGH